MLRTKSEVRSSPIIGTKAESLAARVLGGPVIGLAIGKDPFDAALSEYFGRIAQQGDGLEQPVRHKRLECVELELTGFGGDCDRDVGADHLEGDLVDHLRDHRAYLAGHQ